MSHDPDPKGGALPGGRLGGQARDDPRPARTLSQRQNQKSSAPHGLRHAAITAALDLTGDLQAVQRFSRHKDVRTLTVYDDNRQDLGGDVARRVAAQA